MADNPLRQGPEDYADMGNMLQKVIAKALQQSENMLPVKVVSYDREKNTAIVLPLIKIILTAEVKSRVQIGPIPVFAFGGGNYVINYPLREGDLGWMLANDRDISKFMESLAESEPNTYRTHSFNDAVLFPDAIRNFTTSGEDERMVIQTLDGTVRISLGEADIRLKHPTLVTVETPLAEFTGDIHATGTITGDTDVVFAGISGKGHKHARGTYVAGATPVSGDSAVPHN